MFKSINNDNLTKMLDLLENHNKLLNISLILDQVDFTRENIHEINKILKDKNLLENLTLDFSLKDDILNTEISKLMEGLSNLPNLANLNISIKHTKVDKDVVGSI